MNDIIETTAEETNVEEVASSEYNTTSTEFDPIGNVEIPSEAMDEVQTTDVVEQTEETEQETTETL